EDTDLLYFGNYHIIGSNKRKLLPIHYDNVDSFVALSSGAIWKFCLKKELIMKYPLPSIRNAEDIAVIPLCILSAKNIKFSDKALYYYVHNNESLSSSYSSQVTYNFVKSFDYTLSYLKKPYSPGVEFHGIKTIIYGAVLNGLKASMPWKEIEGIIINFEKEFPHWSQNKYISSYSIRKRIFLQLVKLKKYGLLKWYVSIHNLILRYL
ncbi:MAG: hypothetical protein K2J58_07255, partial [Muribaculaceae bacterium]|nr:hypothetical protein [Muribaculaceae bacterium]